MTHEAAGHYARKHPPGTTHDPALAKALKAAAPEGRVTCRAAHDIATSAEVTPAEVGTNADLLEYRIVECQMGLFGYSPEKRIAKPAPTVAPALREALAKWTSDGVIGCKSCWQVAEELGLSKMDVSSACESLQLKVKPCQLGAF